MPNKKTTLVWDMDGTLVDSYPSITNCLFTTLKDYGVSLSYEEINRRIIATTVSHFLTECAAEYSFDKKEFLQAYIPRAEADVKNITAMPHAVEVLRALRNAGYTNHIITHRDITTYAILENLGIADCFTEIIHAKSGHNRKPDPESMRFLTEKYALALGDVYYVGDRNLDMEFARNSGTGGIMYVPEGSPAVPAGLEDYLVRDLTDILSLPVLD